jgi:hypothetical protein
MKIRMTRFVSIAVFSVALIGGLPSCAEKPRVNKLRVNETSDPVGWQVFDGDLLVAGYISDSQGRPIVYPVIGPSGQPMTRNFPMTAATAFEKTDHDHHRSLWFTHGEVNGVDFWLDDKGTGKIVQKLGSASVDENGVASIVTENDWMAPSGERILSDVRRIAFFVDEGRRVIDFDVLLIASDGDIRFGDTKEGTFGMRVAGSMKTDANQGGVVINANGDKDADAWGKRSPWVDYSGPVFVKNRPFDIAGITIHDCPSSFGYPARWHTRTYGLFAANPFGTYQFEGGEKRHDIVLREGKTMRLNYRVVLHNGGLDVDVAEADSKKFANDPRPELVSERSEE